MPMNKDRIDELEQRVKELEEAVFERSEPRNSFSGKKVSIAEFMRDYDTSNNRKRVLVMGHYLETVDEVDNFSSNDIEEAYKRAKKKPPANPTDPISKNAGKGYIREVGKADNQKLWVLTQTGVERVKELKESEE
jgi:hypothetical protein